MKRVLIIIAAAFGAILLFLLASASANTALFGRHYPLLLLLNAAVALGMFGLVAWQLRELWREHRARVFGSRLKLRLMLMFGTLAVLPGIVVYAVSVQFVTRSIESWFDVRVESALESGLALGRSALDSLLTDLHGKAESMAIELGDRPESARRALLGKLREQTGVHTASLFALNGNLLSSATAELAGIRPSLPDATQLRQARLANGVTAIEGDGAGMLLRVLVPVQRLGLGDEPRILQVTQPVPGSLAQNAESVQAVYRDYQELQLARSGLTRIYALTLTLTMLLALSAAFAVAVIFARRLSAPLSILAEGTQAVAQGDFSPRQAIYSRDELGVLTQSFNQMTRQLDDARRETERHRSDVEAARAYLESILANLSTGVLVFDRRFVLRLLNDGARHIVADEFAGLAGESVEAWPRQSELGRAIRDGFAAEGQTPWQSQLELARQSGPLSGMPQFLLLRGSRLPEAGGGGYVVVFDDITRLIAGQRSAAWGEVARRLAHEIKNPLTPIQLSAERLEIKLADKLAPTDAEVLKRSVRTIVAQVQAMKRMVDDFRDYARLPAPELGTVDLNALVVELLGLYEQSRVRIDTRLADGLPPVLGDTTQLRQVIHNLLRNAEDALDKINSPAIFITTEACPAGVRLTVDDNGPGFPPEIMARIFEPYVTTKAKGTGLGLAIVKKIIDEHHGSVVVGKFDTQGARVSIELPVARAKGAQ